MPTNLHTPRRILNVSVFNGAAIGLMLIALPITMQPAAGQESLRPIAIKIPPRGVKVAPEAVRGLKEQLAAAEKRASQIDHPRRVDADVLLKAVRWAIRHNEFYKPNDIGKAKQLLELAGTRLDALESGKHPWTTESGLVVRGYRSNIDQSVQPYGLHIPAELPRDQPAPLIVWLHGRGDKTTDMHFLLQRLKSPGNVHPSFAITVHPFGRHCMGFKSAGEIDVLDVVKDVSQHYSIDPNRIVLMGFSMGGAGAWHVGAHYADQWVAVSPGAGFAETARYTRLPVDQYPAWYEQRLWGAYDVPGYVRNLFNPTVVAYSGEVDKQIQAARVMEEAFLSQGRKLTHLIGPKMGHKYHPEVLKDLLERMHKAVDEGRDEDPDRVYLQTKTLRYARQYWVEALRLEKHWSDSRVTASRNNDEVQLSTNNVATLRLSPSNAEAIQRVEADGDQLTRPNDSAGPIVLSKVSRRWKWLSREEADKLGQPQSLAKRPGLQGPIDDAFIEPFLLVTPSGDHQHERVDAWVRFELEHFVRRWSSLYRADVLVKRDRDVTANDIASRHLVVFGDPQSNSVLKRALAAKQGPPLTWDRKQIRLNDGREFDAATHAPAFIYPNPLNPSRYLVVNSGPTHREGHDRTNSLQNPKLPDWVIFDLKTPPDDKAAGRVADANFFGEAWELRAANAK